MIVNVRLHATLRRPKPEGGYLDRLTVELNEGATLTSLLESIEVELAPSSLMLILNGRNVGPDQALHDGDDVRLFPPISGGIIKLPCPYPYL